MQICNFANQSMDQQNQKNSEGKTNWLYCFIVIAFGAAIALCVAAYWNWQSKNLDKGLERDNSNFQKEMQILQDKIEKDKNK